MPLKRPMEHSPVTLRELSRRMRSSAAELEKAAADMEAAGIDKMVIDHALSGLRGVQEVETFGRACAAAYYAARETTGAFGILTEYEPEAGVTYRRGHGTSDSPKGKGKR